MVVCSSSEQSKSLSSLVRVVAWPMSDFISSAKKGPARLRYRVQGEELWTSSPSVSLPLVILYTFAYLSAPAAAVVTVLLIPTAGSGNCNVTVTPETMQVVCKGSRDGVDCRSDCI
jgi:hypothetical protein